MTKTLVTTGISGHLGYEAASRLLATTRHRLVGTTRNPERARALEAKGLIVRYANCDDPPSLETAFDGGARLLLVSTGADAAGARRVEQHRHALEAARRAGVRHVVYTSFAKATASPLGAIAADHAATEALIQTVTPSFTVLRNAFYAEMLLSTVPRAIASGRWMSATGTGKVAYVTRADCAHAAAAALDRDDETPRVFEIAGAPIDAEELVRITNEVFGTDIELVALTPHELSGRLELSGVPAPMAKLFAAIDDGIAKGAMHVESDDFEKLTGRAAATVGDFLAEHRDAIVSSATEGQPAR